MLKILSDVSVVRQIFILFWLDYSLEITRLSDFKPKNTNVGSFFKLKKS